MDDHEIIELLNQRNELAISEMKKKYEKICFSIAGKILSQHEDIEECVSEAYYSVWNSIPPRVVSNLKLYLCRLVKNHAVNRLGYNNAQKRNTDFSVSLDELKECIPSMIDIEDCVNSLMLGTAISRFLRSEKEKNRLMFIRRYWYCDSVADIAEMFRTNEKNAAVQLFRTRKRLRKFLEKEGYLNE